MHTQMDNPLRHPVIELRHSLSPNNAASTYLWAMYNGLDHRSTDQLGSSIISGGGAAQIDKQVNAANQAAFTNLVAFLGNQTDTADDHHTVLGSSVHIGDNLMKFIIYPKTPTYSATFEFYVKSSNGDEQIKELYFDNTGVGKGPDGQPMSFIIPVVKD